MRPPERPADVCLVLEGTYPFVRGGVAEWAHLLIQGNPDLTFHLWCITASKVVPELRYELPPNVVGMDTVPLFHARVGSGERPLTPAFWEAVDELYAAPGARDRAQALWERVMPQIHRFEGQLPIDQILMSEEAYERMVVLHGEESSTESFIDFFYTVMYTHFPLMRLLAAPVPRARLYHTIATGYAGLLASRARRETGSPMLLSEHGIYTNERQIEIILARWIYSPPQTRIRVGPDRGRLKRMWMELFDFLGRLTYQESDAITSLFGGNARMQIERGAEPDKIEIIPNGVDLQRFQAKESRRDPARPTVGLVGRVVAIKDIRTFIRACRGVAERMPQARFVVLGPAEEDAAYYKKCLEYRKLLGLEDKLEFTGPVNVAEWYPKLDVMALTSVSEGLPLTVLEAFACRTPVVCTRVGACEELVNGLTPEDRKLGPAGLLADVGDHRAIASGIVRLLEDPQLARRCGDAGRARAERFYDLDRITQRYRSLYERWLSRVA